MGIKEQILNLYLMQEIFFMTNVVLKTDATQSVRCDGMEVLLAIKCEGLSMQASLRKLQESTDQLLASFQSSAIDPSSFSVEMVDAVSTDDGQRQSAKVMLKARGACNFTQLRSIWQTITQMPFAIEMQVRFFLQDETPYYQALHENALVQAQIEAGKFSALLDSGYPDCLSLRFENFQEEGPDLQSILSCDVVDYPEGNYPSFWNQAQPPYITLKTIAETSWTFSSAKL